MKTIVISAVNLVEGGTLTILRDCLRYLSSSNIKNEYRIVAIVFDKELVNFPNIEYIETKWPKRLWVNRLYYEYFSMNKISKQIGDVYLWFSLHDTTPNVKSTRRAVYCHNPFPFYKWKWRECFMTPKIVLFSLFSKFAYAINIKENNHIIVQQNWIRTAFVKMFNLRMQNIIVALPDLPDDQKIPISNKNDSIYRFIYAASPNSHKNFECLTQAIELLVKRSSKPFEVTITIEGSENEYAKWIKKKWGYLKQINFIGFLNRETLFQEYANSDTLVFPSKIETWGLPITEYSTFKKPMLLADLHYAHETAAGTKNIAYFNPDNPVELSNLMYKLINGDISMLVEEPKKIIESPMSNNWKSLFNILLD